jgi:hypothetical protein
MEPAAAASAVGLGIPEDQRLAVDNRGGVFEGL